jgi:phage baseplate assembly protein W
MSYTYIPKYQVKPNDNAYGIDLSSNYPGIFGSLYDTGKQATANLKNLLFTRKGERYHNITFGTNLTYIIFEPNVAELKEDIDSIIRDEVSYWLPYINISDIEIITAEDDPTMNHNIKITITYSINDQPGFENKILIYALENGILSIEDFGQ